MSCGEVEKVSGGRSHSLQRRGGLESGVELVIWWVGLPTKEAIEVRQRRRGVSTYVTNALRRIAMMVAAESSGSAQKYSSLQ